MRELELLHVLAVGAGKEDAFLRLVRDAERYQCLRAQEWDKNLLAVVDDPKNAIKLGYECLSHARLDDRIDLVMMALRLPAKPGKTKSNEPAS